MNILAILREERFSPNMVAQDRAIMMAVVERLSALGHAVRVVSEHEPALPRQACDVILSMGRLPKTLAWLKQQPVRVINTPQAIERCARSQVARIMQEHDIPAAPAKGIDGYWLKRGDACAQEKDDVVFARDERELKRRIETFCKRGIMDYVVSAHVEGDLLKIYGVRGTGFFRFFYPTDDGQSKFGNEQHNPAPHHYAFDQQKLQQLMERLADAIGVDVYGGDCIVRQDGRLCIIDFNDWPSFSRCREDAAEAIVRLVTDGEGHAF